MGLLLPHRVLLTYNVDEAIETLPISSNARPRVDRCLMLHAPTAYQPPGVPLEKIWQQLPSDVQEALNEAAVKTFGDSFADAYYKKQAGIGRP